jgi:hypothetical protein
MLKMGVISPFLNSFKRHLPLRPRPVSGSPLYICKVVEVIELQFVYILRNQVISFKVLIFLFFWTFSSQVNPFYSVRTEDYRH